MGLSFFHLPGCVPRMKLLSQGWEPQLQSAHLLSLPHRNASVRAPWLSDVDGGSLLPDPYPGREGWCSWWGHPRHPSSSCCCSAVKARNFWGNGSSRKLSWLCGCPVCSRWKIPVLKRQGKKIKSPSEQSSQAEPGNIRNASVNTAAEASRQAGRFLIIDGAYK